MATTQNAITPRPRTTSSPLEQAFDSLWLREIAGLSLRQVECKLLNVLARAACLARLESGSVALGVGSRTRTFSFHFETMNRAIVGSNSMSGALRTDTQMYG